MENLNKSGYFITGIGTDVGKTYISSLLYKSLAKKMKVGYYKPIQSGCFYKENKKIAPDVEFLCDFNEIDYDEEMCTITLIPELSPHLASEIDKQKIDMKEIYKSLCKKREKYSVLLVEGAGGIYVPIIRNKVYIFDLIKKLNLPVILVASAKVGGINQTMLTIDFIKRQGIQIQGLVFNNYGDAHYEKDNIKIILEDSKIKNYITVTKGQKIIEDNEIIKLLGEESDENKK